jgi:hypothetical protein
MEPHAKFGSLWVFGFGVLLGSSPAVWHPIFVSPPSLPFSLLSGFTGDTASIRWASGAGSGSQGDGSLGGDSQSWGC